VSGEKKTGLGPAGFITIGVFLAYIGLEIFAVSRTHDRIEPEQIYRDFVGARRAVARCGIDPPERADFERNFGVVAAKAREALSETASGTTEQEVETALNALREAREAEVDALIGEEGCKGKGVWRLIKLYEVRSRLTLRPR